MKKVIFLFVFFLVIGVTADVSVRDFVAYKKGFKKSDSTCIRVVSIYQPTFRKLVGRVVIEDYQFSDLYDTSLFYIEWDAYRVIRYFGDDGVIDSTKQTSATDSLNSKIEKYKDYIKEVIE